jgi:hypothetical protein
MILIRDVPRIGTLPALRFYKCQQCGVPLTETVEVGGGSAPKPSEAGARLSYPSPGMARYEIPKQLPEFVECGNAFVPSNEATLEEWQRHKNPDNSVDQILKLAAKLALPDNVPLLPRLRALAKSNVLVFNRKF